jgi:prepilin-type N-terminal cleavage/methylation domain-containing protein
MEKINSRGFTFLEVLGVLVIIGILSLVWFARQGGREDTARIEASTDAMTKVATAVEEWRLRQGQTNYAGLTTGSLANSGVVPLSLLRENPFGKWTNWPAPYQGINVGATGSGGGYYVVLAASNLQGDCGTQCTQAVARNLCNRGFAVTCYANFGIIGYSDVVNCPWGTRILCN